MESSDLTLISVSESTIHYYTYIKYKTLENNSFISEKTINSALKFILCIKIIIIYYPAFDILTIFAIRKL